MILLRPMALPTEKPLAGEYGVNKQIRPSAMPFRIAGLSIAFFSESATSENSSIPRRDRFVHRVAVHRVP